MRHKVVSQWTRRQLRHILSVCAIGVLAGASATLTGLLSPQIAFALPASNSISIDYQVSVNGTTWQDVGSGVLQDPSVLIGDTVYERVIVSNNTGSSSLTNVQVTDTAGISFTFGTSQPISLAAGQADVAQVRAGPVGHQIDTATASGTVSGTTTTVSASDSVDYSALSMSVSIDKQISVNGGATWVDVGNGVLQDPQTTTGTTVEERVLVTNTGGVSISGVTVTDVNGPQNFTFGGNLTTTLAVGETATSDVASFPASTGHEIDTATATGNVTDGFNTGTVSASDQADYTGQASQAAPTTPYTFVPLSVGTSFAWDGQYGVPYNALQLQAVSGQAPYEWSLVSGSLPSGLTLSDSGVISGTPTGPNGTSTFTVQVKAANGMARRSLSIIINGAPSLSVETMSLPSGTDDKAYSSQLQGMGVSPLSWSIASGSLPAGMSLNTDGTVTGTPRESGQFTFTVQVTDASGSVVQHSFMLHIARLGANQRIITMTGQTVVVPGFVQHNTTYMPIWYVMQLLRQAEIQSTWDGANWYIVAASKPDLSNSKVGNGRADIYVNGTLVKKLDTVAATDPSTGKLTTYMPIWYVMQILKSAGLYSTWDGTTWTVTK